MTDEERTQILEYREQNMGYRNISKLMDIPESTIKSFCKREKRDQESSTCLQCGKALIQIEGTKRKKFCSDKCRMAWWNAHKSQVNKKTFHEYICPACGKPFKVYGNVSRKYCSTDCYLDDRFDRKRKAAQAAVEDNMPAETAIVPETVNNPTEDVKRRKVAGYARVSTDMEEQQNSYATQMKYYRNYIIHHDDWEFVGMYSDEGISATNMKLRVGFNTMIEDALAGKIDLIITKSISRFCRNTVDMLTTIRKLKNKGVEVFFERENIWTLDSSGELLISIMSSYAQEESRSISENTKWGKRKAFADGKASVTFSQFLGYDEGFVINEEEAETVRLIFKMFVSGCTTYIISKALEGMGRKTGMGSTKWYTSTITGILMNEKYKGDLLLQKTYTVDFLEKKQKKNEGEVKQYYFKDHHPAIIDPETFDYVQEELKRRQKRK